MPSQSSGCIAKICSSGFGAVPIQGLPDIPKARQGRTLYIPAENYAPKEETFVLRFRHVHESGTDALIIQQQNGWRIQITFREPNHDPSTITGYLVPSVERAKQIADKEVSRYGHVCNGGCQDWVELP